MNTITRSDLDEEIRAVKAALEDFRTGWERSDADQILGTIAQQENVVIYGTDLVERWIGYDEFVDPVLEQVQILINPVYTWGANEPRINIQGNTSWASGDLNVKFEINGISQNISMRSTFVLSKLTTGWKIVQAHFSIGQEDAVVEY